MSEVTLTKDDKETLTSLLRDFGFRRDAYIGDDLVERRYALADRLYRLAIDKGDISAIKYIFDRIDGMPTQKLEAPDSCIIVTPLSFVEPNRTETVERAEIAISENISIAEPRNVTEDLND